VEVLTKEFKSANPWVILRLPKKMSYGPNFHFRIQAFTDEDGTVRISEEDSSVDTYGNPSGWEYCHQYDKYPWGPWYSLPPTGIPATTYTYDDVYIRKRVFVGPREHVWLKADVGTVV
jgi:hypothetical protein